MSKVRTLLLALSIFAMGLTAPFVVPLALIFTRRDALDLAWPWYDTPDEPGFIGLYEPTIAKAFGDGQGWRWWWSAYLWFGLRNRAHGYASSLARPAFHWDDPAFWRYEKQLGPLKFFFGWQVYASKQFDTHFEARPRISVKWRPQK